LALIGYGLCRVNAGIDAWVTKFYREVAGPYWPPQRQHLDTAYSHLYFPFTPIATPDLEMVMPVNLHHFLGYLSTWSAVQLRQKQTGINPIPNLKKQLQACWPAKQVREVRFPLFIKAGLVR
ncbi:MAG TPA: hypothetical protein PKD90_09215, partial [Phnomibacter sp.]|nr:hypothetical protein [Phnomibacter sp.]